ncbi:hypothetical protein BDV97DRAFT_27608 [Delphinella strobiligena]|nr:hypothetical protein BDV97DRAFT_27608 [Delphinella strobiligena]
MHFATSVVVSLFALTVAAAPLDLHARQGRRLAVVRRGDEDESYDPAVDVLDLVVDGVNGFETVVDGVVDGQVGNAKRQLPQPADDPVDDLLFDVGDGGIAVGGALDDALRVEKRDDEVADILDSVGAGADELVEVVGSVTQNAENTPSKRDDEAADLLDSVGAGVDELVEVVGSVTQNAGNTP